MTRPKKIKMLPKRALEKRDQSMARYVAFVFEYLDAGFGSSINMQCVQHGEPDQFYAVLEVGKEWTHERLEALLELVKKHNGKLHFHERRTTIFLSRDV